MLYLIALPPPLQPGNFEVRRASADEAGRLIYESASLKALTNRITFQSTADLVQKISGIKLRNLAKAPRQLKLLDGDTLLQVKLREGVDAEAARQWLSVDDVEFLFVLYEGME